MFASRHLHSASSKGSALRTPWRWMVHACLILLLLLTQQGAWRHALSHWAPTQEPTHQAGSGTHRSPAAEHAEAPCLQCLAYSALANTLQQASATERPCLLGDVCTPTAAHTPHEASALLAYRSRAPPVV